MSYVYTAPHRWDSSGSCPDCGGPVFRGACMQTNECPPALLRNMAKCKVCQTVVESVRVHDFQTCKCGNLSVDGGKQYLRRAFRDANEIVELSLYADHSHLNRGKCGYCPPR